MKLPEPPIANAIGGGRKPHSCRVLRKERSFRPSISREMAQKNEAPGSTPRRLARVGPAPTQLQLLTLPRYCFCASVSVTDCVRSLPEPSSTGTGEPGEVVKLTPLGPATLSEKVPG